ncbi:hypothetical protein [Rufibacter sp. XAAS-G3-1]|uniref:hypothetical protein n=1 Tax=Rufibacter sp. XAAS-G3-1 TaxID=2729134 RepID=UPI0015E77E0B|nr:hypothetical protein [Rufibacter sp. XAAS-G3-1]
MKHAAIDYEKWDACLTKASNGMIYGFSWYLDIVSPGWAAIVKEERGEYEAVMPLPVARKFGILYLRQPLFAQQLGVFYQQPITEEEWVEIGRLLTSKFQMISRYEFNTENFKAVPTTGADLESRLFTTYHLDLSQDYGSIVSRYRKDRRWRINKAKRSKLTIKPSVDIDLMLDIFHLYVTPKIEGVIGEAYEYRLIRQLYGEAKRRRMAFMYQVENEEEQVLAMGLFFLFHKKMIYIYNASTPEGKRLGGISLLVDYVLHKYAGQEIVFDFEAPEVDHIADFYSSFGSVKTHFLSISRNNLPAPLKLLKRLRMKWYQSK